MSKIIRERNLDIETAARLVRGEIRGDCRPNKGLDAAQFRTSLAGYLHEDLLVDIALYGVTPSWVHQTTNITHPPKNRQSCRRHLRAVARSIREGQIAGQYMVVDAGIMPLWPPLVCSPFGAAEKKGVDLPIEVRLIRDLSSPPGSSTNDLFEKSSAPAISYNYITMLAWRIEHLVTTHPNKTIWVLKGDVKSAFRHLMTNVCHAHCMSALIRELRVLVIDLAAPFGWPGSPLFYSGFGRAISWLVLRSSPATVSDFTDREAFFSYGWVDDHVLIEIDQGQRLQLAEATLWHAMTAILGPRSINESKFSTWSTDIIVLGLRWNTVLRTVLVPDNKIEKGLARVRQMPDKDSASRSDLQKLIGSLRHVDTCLRTAKPFYQRIQSQCSSGPRFGQVKLASGAVQDLSWFYHILQHGQLQELPLKMFGSLPEPDVHLYMDASDGGLAILNPACDEYIQLQFDSEKVDLILYASEGKGEF